MADYLDFDRRLYEFTVVALAQGEDSLAECTDLSEHGGSIGTIRFRADGTGELSLDVSSVPLEVMRAWMRIVDGSPS